MEEINGTSSYGVVIPPKCYPHSIVWAPIPLVTWLFPFIGHTGICTAEGAIHDFTPAGVLVNSFAFGNPTRYIQLRPEAARSLDRSVDINSSWDQSLRYSQDVFNSRTYNLCGSNCHRFVNFFLETVKFGDRIEWGAVRLGWLMFWHGKLVSAAGLAKTFLPFIVMATLTLVFLPVPVYMIIGGWVAVCLTLVGLLHVSDLFIRSYERRAGMHDLTGIRNRHYERESGDLPHARLHSKPRYTDLFVS